MAELIVELCGRTDVGLVRDANEDRLTVADLDAGKLLEVSSAISCDADRRGPLLIVCDGMGGVHGGEIAASIAADVIWREMSRAPFTSAPNFSVAHRATTLTTSVISAAKRTCRVLSSEAATITMTDGTAKRLWRTMK